jgi:hypothetical protein
MMKLYEIINDEKLERLESVFVNSVKGTIMYKENKGQINYVYEIEPIKRLDNMYFVSNKYKEFHGAKIKGLRYNPFPNKFKK